MKLTRFLIMLVVLLLSVPAFADEEPLKLGFVNAAAKGGESAYDTINAFLKKSGDINTTDQSDIWKYAKKEFDLEEKHFRSTSLREDNAKNFQKIMKELDLEAIMILDVFSKGKKLQVVTIGPSGKQIADVRRDVTRGRLDKDDAKGVLKETFAELVPNVVDFRKEGGWDSVSFEEEAAPDEEEEEEEVSLMPDEEEEEEEDNSDEELTLKEKALKKKREGGSPELEPGIRLKIGLLAGKRDLRMTSDSGFELTHGSPFVGFGGRISFIFASLGTDAAIGGTLLGGYAPFTTIFGENEDYKSQYARIGLELNYLKAFSETFMVNLFGGGEATSITIAQNRNYTGHRYVMARAGAGLMYQVGPVLLEAGVALLPVFGVNNSSGAYGEVPGLTLGFEPMAGLTFGLSEDISVTLRYSGEIFSAKYPEPVLAIGPAKSFDIIHSGLIAIGYSL